jgi:hypothetical protein
MREYALDVLMLCLMLMVLPTVCAAPLERVLPVSVNIVTNQTSPDLEIVADKDAFLVVYNTVSQQFLPLNIPFKVHSVGGLSVAYNLSLSQLGGQCDTGLHLAPSAALDGTDVGLAQPRRFTGTDNAHVLTLTFPSMPQADLAQQCEGYAGVVAELTV